MFDSYVFWSRLGQDSFVQETEGRQKFDLIIYFNIKIFGVLCNFWICFQLKNGSKQKCFKQRIGAWCKRKYREVQTKQNKEDV